MKIDYDDIETAFEFSSVDDSYGEHAAYLCIESGKIYYDSDASEDVLPDDLYENDKYIEIPNKHDLDLGKPLVLKFITEHLPDDLETVYAIFRSKGAYSRYKALLDDRDSLDKWYIFEQAAQREELLNWCNFNGIEVNI